MYVNVSILHGCTASAVGRGLYYHFHSVRDCVWPWEVLLQFSSVSWL